MNGTDILIAFGIGLPLWGLLGIFASVMSRIILIEGDDDE